MRLHILWLPDTTSRRSRRTTSSTRQLLLLLRRLLRRSRTSGSLLRKNHVGIGEPGTDRDEKVHSTLKVRSELSNFKVTNWSPFLVHAQPWLALLTCLCRQQDVRVTLLPVDTPGYKLEFEFAENEFFSNTILTKVYYCEVGPTLVMTCTLHLIDLQLLHQDELDYQGDYVYKNARSRGRMTRRT